MFTSLPVPILVAGDFNFHMDVSDDYEAIHMHDLLDSSSLDQHVTVPTHKCGHTLDLSSHENLMIMLSVLTYALIAACLLIILQFHICSKCLVPKPQRRTYPSANYVTSTSTISAKTSLSLLCVQILQTRLSHSVFNFPKF